MNTARQTVSRKSRFLKPAERRREEDRKAVIPALIASPEACAKAAGLRYVTDSRPGILRHRSGRGFTYTNPDGDRVKDRETLDRIRSLVIPPAWTEVWISPLPEGHLQATGRDARGRKQYLYHPLWRKVSGEIKFNRMVAFGTALPIIRQRTERHLSLPGLARNKVLATVVRLLQKTLIRIGNKEYARENDSFGLTTLRNKHLDLSGSRMRFQFRGKSGVDHTVEIHDRRLAKVVRRCRDIPGHELFQYVDDEGVVRSIDSADVNTYLQEITGEGFTAKDFRTWGGTVCIARTLFESGPFTSEKEAKKNIVQAVKAAASYLANKPSVARKYYIHPAVIDAYMNGTLVRELQASPAGMDIPGLDSMENIVLRIITRYDLSAAA